MTGVKANICDINCPYKWADRSLDDGFEFTAPVGSYPDGASPYGALDMEGNVWEWVADWYDEYYYSRSPRKNPKGPSIGVDRVLRGGSWSYDRGFLRVSDRRWRFDPVFRSSDFGFRCLCSP